MDLRERLPLFTLRAQGGERRERKIVLRIVVQRELEERERARLAPFAAEGDLGLQEAVVPSLPTAAFEAAQRVDHAVEAGPVFEPLVEVSQPREEPDVAAAAQIRALERVGGALQIAQPVFEQARHGSELVRALRRLPQRCDTRPAELGDAPPVLVAGRDPGEAVDRSQVPGARRERSFEPRRRLVHFALRVLHLADAGEDGRLRRGVGRVFAVEDGLVRLDRAVPVARPAQVRGLGEQRRGRGHRRDRRPGRLLLLCRLRRRLLDVEHEVGQRRPRVTRRREVLVGTRRRAIGGGHGPPSVADGTVIDARRCRIGGISLVARGGLEPPTFG